MTQQSTLCDDDNNNDNNIDDNNNNDDDDKMTDNKDCACRRCCKADHSCDKDVTRLGEIAFVMTMSQGLSLLHHHVTRLKEIGLTKKML